MGEKVTDLMGSLNFEIGQNFKNRGHLYNKHEKFIYRWLYEEFCPYQNLYFIFAHNKQQVDYNNLTSKNIVPIMELKYLTRKNCLFSAELVVLCSKVQLNVNIAHENLFLFGSDGLFCPGWAIMPPEPKNVPERKLGAFVHHIGTNQAHPSRLPSIPYEELCAIVLGSRGVINVVYDLDKCLVGFLEYTLRCKFEDESVHRGTCQMTKFLHKLLRYHLAHCFYIALNLRRSPSVNSFTRHAVDEMREHCSFENFDYLPQCVLSLGNLVAKITFVFSTPLVLLDAQSFVRECNKPLVTFRNVEMISLVVLCLDKQSASLGVADIAYFHYLIGGRVEYLGIVIGHSDSNIKGIRFIITFGSPKVINQVLHNEVVCSFAFYHIVLLYLLKGKNKTLTPSVVWHKGFYILMGLRLQNIPKNLHHDRLVTVQNYNEYLNYARNVNSDLTFGDGYNFRKIAATENKQFYNSLKIRTLKSNSKWNTCQRNIYGCFCGLPP